MDIPPELLESANLNDPGEAVQGITKFSGVSALINVQQSQTFHRSYKTHGQ